MTFLGVTATHYGNRHNGGAEWHDAVEPSSSSLVAHVASVHNRRKLSCGQSPEIFTVSFKDIE